jgi:hypothetical protein
MIAPKPASKHLVLDSLRRECDKDEKAAGMFCEPDVDLREDLGKLRDLAF